MWGRDRGGIPDLEFYRMLSAYARRKKWEAAMVAGEVWGLLGKAMEGGQVTGTGKVPVTKAREVGADELLRRVGLKMDPARGMPE